ncbi:MAG: hypothetical protein J0L87_01775 [Bacteroidetes bacterium]|nr:hypothetical protein [Bacteroidia bacterium]MBN8695232.1 hypothetical protein [Bacteroidota bacterium]
MKKLIVFVVASCLSIITTQAQDLSQTISSQEIAKSTEIKDGAVTYYYANGNVMEKGAFLNGEKTGEWIRWSEEGKKIAQAFYKEGKKDGLWIVWDANGTKRYEMNYAMGQKVGKWMMWDEQGNLISEKDYSAI